MFTNNYQEDEQYLHDQVYLTILNDGKIYRELQPLVVGGFFESFADKVCGYIDVHMYSVVRSNVSAKESPIRRFIPMAKSRSVYALWKHMVDAHDSSLDCHGHISTPAGRKSYENYEARTQITSEDMRKHYTHEPTTPVHDDQMDAMAYAINLIQPKELTTMSITNISIESAIPTQTITFVYGEDVSKMKEEQLIASIKRAENEIAQLESIKTVSKTLALRKSDIQAAIAKMVEALENVSA